MLNVAYTLKQKPLQISCLEKNFNLRIQRIHIPAGMIYDGMV